MIRSLAASFALTVGLAGAGQALAQVVAPPAGTVSAGVQSQNIFDVRPDASTDPGYAAQTNAERAKVQPGNNAPMWRQVGAGVAGTSTLPKSQAPEAGVLIQPFVQYPGSRLTNAGQAWREVRNNWIIPYGGSLLLLVVAAIALFYWRKGTLVQHAKDTGRVIERFSAFERAAHWANAITFVVLALSGLVMAFGKFFIEPVIGLTLFGWLAYVLKTLHNFAGPLFAVSLVVVFLTFVRDNLPRPGDLAWLAGGGGMLSGKEKPSHRFNAGEKVVFWAGVFVLGLVVTGSGLVMDQLLPGLVYERATMQITHMVHAVAAVLMMVLFLGHIYLGTIGSAGAYRGMKTGYVDEAWAKQNHELWYDDVKAGKIPAQRGTTAAPKQALEGL